MSCENLNALAKMSNKYGSDSNFVLAGGGNTSYKDEEYLYIKGSGTCYDSAGGLCGYEPRRAGNHLEQAVFR